MSDDIEVLSEATSQGVVTVRLNAPDRRNALTGAMARTLVEHLERADADSTVGAIIITGSADGFCAGAKRELLADVAAQDPRALDDIQDVYRIFDAIRSCSVPVIAAVRGPAVGAGLNIALAADVRVVATDAFLRSMFLANHIHPGGAHLRMLSRLAGPELTTVMAVLDEPLIGADFARLGGAFAAVEGTEVEATAHRFAKRVAEQPQLARMIKQSIRDTDGVSDQVASRIEGERQVRTLFSPQRS